MNDRTTPTMRGANTRARRPLWVVVGIIAASALLLAGGWALASAFRSPAQIAADAAPPTPSRITATVTKGSLSERINMSGNVQAAHQDEVAITPSASDPVVTLSPLEKGDSVAAGEVALEINTKPVFLMPGSFPFFRDLTPGDSGRDVTQLQKGLRSAGFTVTVDGQFGPSTASALRALYRRADYSVPTTTVGDSGESGQATPSDSPAGGDSDDGADDKTEAKTVVVAHPSAFAIVATLPGTVVSVPSVGTFDPDKHMVVASGARVVTADILQGTAQKLEEGFPATTSVKKKTVELTLAKIGKPDDDGNITVRFSVEKGADIPDDALGANVTIAVTRNVIADDALLVPSVAVASRGKHRYVLVRGDDGTFEEVGVHELGTLDGTSAVEPIKEDALGEGDRVRVQ